MSCIIYLQKVKSQKPYLLTYIKTNYVTYCFEPFYLFTSLTKIQIALFIIRDRGTCVTVQGYLGDKYLKLHCCQVFSTHYLRVTHTPLQVQRLGDNKQRNYQTTCISILKMDVTVNFSLR